VTGDAVIPQVPLWFDLIAVFVGGVSGTILAARKGFDLSGVLVIAIVAGMGGGIIRDVLISRGAPAALENQWYLYMALIAAGVGFLFAGLMRHVDLAFIVIDALSLGLYTLAGLSKGLSAELPIVSAILLGVVTATGGGVLRDLLSGEAPRVLRPGTLLLTASVVGAVVYAVLDFAGVNKQAGWIAIAIVVGLRLASVRFGWTTPEAAFLQDRVGALGTTVATRATGIVRMPGREGKE
jgi:uncharacterized membrane protein YeiH